MVSLAPFLEEVEVGDDDGRGELLALAEDDDVLEELALSELLFDDFRVDIFAHGGLEEALQSSGDVKLTVFVEVADVARVEPSVGVNDFLGEFRVLVVAHHHVMAAAADLAVGLHLDLNAGQGGTDGADFTAVGVVVADGDDGGGLGHAIAFVDRHLDGGEEGGDLRLDAGGAGDHNIEMLRTQVGTDGLVHQLVGDG